MWRESCAGWRRLVEIVFRVLRRYVEGLARRSAAFEAVPRAQSRDQHGHLPQLYFATCPGGRSLVSSRLQSLRSLPRCRCGRGDSHVRRAGSGLRTAMHATGAVGSSWRVCRFATYSMQATESEESTPVSVCLSKLLASVGESNARPASSARGDARGRVRAARTLAWPAWRGVHWGIGSLAGEWRERFSGHARARPARYRRPCAIRAVRACRATAATADGGLS